MPKGIYIRSDHHVNVSKTNGKTQLGKVPHNAKYIVGHIQGDYKIVNRITPIGEKINGHRNIKYQCVCLKCNEVKELTVRDFYAGYNLKCTQHHIRPYNWGGHELITGAYWTRIKKQAVSRKIEFSISIEYAWSIVVQQNKKCVYTGIDLIFSNGKSGGTASLDRIDNTKGYVVGNIQWVHKDVNMMKRDFTEEYFYDLCKIITERKNVGH